MIHILKVRGVQQAEKRWLALYTQKEPPYYFTRSIDFWVTCRVVELDQLHEVIRNVLLHGRPLGEDVEIVEAAAEEGVFAADVTDGGFCGDLGLCQESDNFVRVIPDDYPKDDLVNEFKRKPPKSVPEAAE